MAAGAFAALNSESEVSDIEIRKQKFLGKESGEASENNPLTSGVFVDISYFIGAMVPVLPVLFGAENLLWSAVVAIIVIILISYVLGFLSGMRIRRRIAINLIIIAIAVGVTYTLEVAANQIWGLRL
jgi:VIT1/CCC1 family predicted Fe2+/Mn2+ transporter